MDYPEQKIRANYLLSPFRDLDWSFIIVHFLSFLAFLLTYDAVSGEREDGTLRLLMANSVGRSKVLLAKFLGVFLIIMIPLALGIVVDILILMVSGSVAFELSDWAKLLCVIGVSVIFLSLFLFIGLLVSIKSVNPVVSMISLLLIWTMLVIIVPSTGKIFAAKFYRIPTRTIMDEEITEKQREIWSNRAGGNPPRPIYASCLGGGIPGQRGHSWTEIWSGRWHYIGSCEPGGRLDRAWFTLELNSVAKVYTVDYEKPNDRSGTFRYGGLGLKDVTSRYTKVGTLKVRVTRATQILPGCYVNFSVLYPSDNTWYPVASALTDEHGMVEMVLGANAGPYKITVENPGHGCEQPVRIAADETREIELKVG